MTEYETGRFDTLWSQVEIDRLERTRKFRAGYYLIGAAVLTLCAMISAGWV